MRLHVYDLINFVLSLYFQKVYIFSNIAIILIASDAFLHFRNKNFDSQMNCFHYVIDE